MKSSSVLFAILMLHEMTFLLSALFALTFSISSFSQSTMIIKPIISLCIGGRSTCAAFDNGKMKCWGSKKTWGSSSLNTDYLSDSPTEIGNAIPYINIGTGVVIKALTCGFFHICMQLDTDDLKCIGNNNYGQCGIGNPTDPVGSATGFAGETLPLVDLGSGRKIQSVALGTYSTCVVVTGNFVKCFGQSQFGQLGYGTTSSKGSSSTDMGDSLPPVDFGAGVEIASVHSSDVAVHNCVILSAPIADAGRIKCWGYNSKYQLGYGTIFGTNNRGDAASEMGTNLPLVDLGAQSKVKQIAIGSEFSCAILINGNLKCWGSNAYGELGLGITGVVSSTGDSLPTVLLDQSAVLSVVQTGNFHTCVMYDDQLTVKCLGQNIYGQLGQGDTMQRGDSTSTKYPNISKIEFGVGTLKIKSLHVGYLHNCVVFNDNSLKCFGENSRGQLGIGSTSNIGDGTNEMGNDLMFTALFLLTSAPTDTPTNTPSQSPTPPTQAPSTTPTKSPTQPPIKIPTRSPTRTPSKSPSNTPTVHPTSPPTLPCDYQSAKLCKYDIKCYWKKVDGVKKCVIFDCLTLNKGKCAKERKRCKWNKKESTCISMKK